jgi:hypothetical protein
MKKAFVFVAILALVACALFAGDVKPFGIEFGKTVASQNLNVEYGPMEVLPGLNSYVVTPPKKHTQLDTYIIYETEKYGIVKLKANKTVQTTYYGTAVKDLFNTLEKGLTSAYGDGIKYDYLDKNSIWKDADDWMYALRYGDRQLWEIWYAEGKELTKGTGTSYLVALEATADSSSEGTVEVIYESPLWGTALDEAQSVDDSVF